MMCVTPSPIRTITVGSGITPDLHKVLAGFTAGGESHPALRSTTRTIAINGQNLNLTPRPIHITDPVIIKLGPVHACPLFVRQ